MSHFKRAIIGPLTKRHEKAFRWHADECPTLNAGLAAAIFQGIRTCIARKHFCDFSVWGSGPGSAHVISRYFGTYNVRQRLRRACASVHFQYRNVKHHRFYVEWVINFVSHDSNHNLEKRPVCI